LGGVDTNFFNSARPFSNDYGRTKGFTYEGGIRIPMIASWPNKIKPGTKTDHISAFWDVLPTFGDLVKEENPEGIDGISFLPTLLNNKNQKEHEFLYWEFPSYQGQQAVRMGDWKGIRKDIFKGNLKIELYNLKNDLTESIDVSDENPEIISQIKEIMKREHTPADIERFKIKQLGDELSEESK
jgi:arylsulfatase